MHDQGDLQEAATLSSLEEEARKATHEGL